MTWPVLLFIALEAAVFVYWAIHLLRVLVRLVSSAIGRAGQSLPGPHSVAGAVSAWFRDPRETEARRALVGSTALMGALFLISSYT